MLPEMPQKHGNGRAVIAEELQAVGLMRLDQDLARNEAAGVMQRR
jgi:hypothetical protein